MGGKGGGGAGFEDCSWPEWWLWGPHVLIAFVSLSTCGGGCGGPCERVAARARARPGAVFERACTSLKGQTKAKRDPPRRRWPGNSWHLSHKACACVLDTHLDRQDRAQGRCSARGNLQAQRHVARQNGMPLHQAHSRPMTCTSKCQARVLQSSCSMPAAASRAHRRKTQARRLRLSLVVVVERERAHHGR